MARKARISPEGMVELAKLYNREGLKSVKKILESEHDIKQPYAFIRRMKDDESLGYDMVSNRFLLDDSSPEASDEASEGKEESCETENVEAAPKEEVEVPEQQQEAAAAGEADKDADGAQVEPADAADALDDIDVFSSKNAAMEKMVHELVAERLLELDRYVTLNTLSKMMVVDETRLVNDGFTVLYQ